jgi:hypothetical protein
MLVNGSTCSILLKTTQGNVDLPFSKETLREAYSLLQEEASIEGDGTCKAIRKNAGITGCVITPLTISTAPLLLYLAMGASCKPFFVSQTRNLYRHDLDLVPMEDDYGFELFQDRTGEIKWLPGCSVTSFELRINRGEAIKLKLDVFSEYAPTVYPYKDKIEKNNEERFYGENVTYKINGKEYKNIYGITLTCRKEGGTKTELWIKRGLETGSDIPEIIDEIIITVKLLRDEYEAKRFGLFRLTLKRLVITSDETYVNSADAVIGPLRYYVSGTVYTQVFSSCEEVLHDIL